MAKREQEKAIEATKKMAEEARSVTDRHDTAQTLGAIEQHRMATQETIHRSLDETKKNISKSIDEATSQIPQYTGAVKSYQEQVLEATREMTFDYIEAQKSVMDSILNSAMWVPYYENAYKIYNYWLSPKIPTEIYTRTVSNIADSISASARMANNIAFGNIDVLTIAFEKAQQNTKDLSRLQVNTAKVFEEAARSAATA